MYPKSSNRAERLGTHFHFNTDVISGYASYVPLAFTGGMPINQSNRRVKGVYVSGGAWRMWKDVRTTRASNSVSVWRSGHVFYKGSFVPRGGGNLAPSGWNSKATLDGEESALFNRGAEAWNLVRPDLPDFSFATSVYELRELIPGLKHRLLTIIRKVRGVVLKRTKGKRSNLSRIAELHIAIQFGYIPLLRDIQNYVQAQNNAQKRLAQLIRDAGKPVRRKRDMKDIWGDDQSQTFRADYPTSASGTSQNPVLVSQAYWRSNTDCFLETRTKTSAKTWVEGRFRYLLPKGPRNVDWKKKMLRRIMGHRIGPRELYAVIPWSWLADYFTGLGSFIGAISDGVADRLISDYCYLMREKHWFSSHTSSMGYVGNANITKRVVAVSTETHERTTKMRIRASPFGFGLKDNDLTPKQVSILGALGLSRLP